MLRFFQGLSHVLFRSSAAWGEKKLKSIEPMPAENRTAPNPKSGTKHPSGLVGNPHPCYSAEVVRT